MKDLLWISREHLGNS